MIYWGLLCWILGSIGDLKNVNAFNQISDNKIIMSMFVRFLDNDQQSGNGQHLHKPKQNYWYKGKLHYSINQYIQQVCAPLHTYTVYHIVNIYFFIFFLITKKKKARTKQGKQKMKNALLYHFCVFPSCSVLNFFQCV